MGGGFLTDVILRDVAIWLAVTLILGGAGALATGRALARGWQPIGKLVPYMMILAAASSFLCWALFDTPVLKISRLAQAVMAGDWEEALLSLGGYAASFVILGMVAAVGFRWTRVRQMQRQYPFLAEKSGA